MSGSKTTRQLNRDEQADYERAYFHEFGRLPADAQVHEYVEQHENGNTFVERPLTDEDRREALERHNEETDETDANDSEEDVEVSEDETDSE